MCSSQQYICGSFSKTKKQVEVNFFCIYTPLLFCFMRLNYWFLISIISRENSDISFRVIAVSAQMTGSLNKSLCGSSLKHKRDVERSWLAPLITVHLFFQWSDTVWARPVFSQTEDKSGKTSDLIRWLFITRLTSDGKSLFSHSHPVCFWMSVQKNILLQKYTFSTFLYSRAHSWI